MFTLRQLELTAAELERDARMVRDDLARLKFILEGESHRLCHLCSASIW